MILNLPSLKVVRVDTLEDLDYHFYCIPTDEPKCCRKCESPDLYNHGYKGHLYVDTPIHGRRVGILLSRRRYKCRSCGATFFQSCDDVSERHRTTRRLVTYVENYGLSRTFTSIADEIGLTEGTVRNIVGHYIAKLEQMFSFEPPEILGIDEVHLNRQMRLVLTNIGKTVFLTSLATVKNRQ
jgi:transposase